ncbi:cytochrome P450 [Nakamurella flavida]|uniref:Cytochrome P450 n=1 Tax=Nakamurella flavida TaxID=363630 RepID=A0A938YKP8_9ACTN|nr:cytochrome P450 [Nakamurella flavida]MBM9476321.1 cytochrome P450 [Nakamurella flavida]MDP9779578.1 cytochrome P450 [Nakamurella flavida]
MTASTAAAPSRAPRPPAADRSAHPTPRPGHGASLAGLAGDLWRYFVDADFRRTDAETLFTALPVRAPVLGLPNFWVVSGYDAVRRLSTRPELVMPPARFPAEVADRLPGFVDFFTRSLSFLPGPDHQRLRGVLGPHLSPAAVDGLLPLVTDLVTDLLGPADGRPVDLVSTVAEPLPVLVTAHLLGVDAVDHRWLTTRVAGLLAVLQTSFPGAGDRPAHPMDAAEFAELAELAEHLVDSPAASGRLLAGIQTSCRAGDLTRDEATRLVLLLFMTGVDTVTTGLTNTVHVLLDHPGEWDRLRAGTVSAPALSAEALRVLTPSSFASRTVTTDLRIGGSTLRAGDAVLLCLAAANRDPARYPDPGAFRPERTPAGSAAFGFGLHHCLGAALAGVQTTATLQVLADRDVRRADDRPLPWRTDLTFRSPAALPVVLGGAR